MHQGGSPEISDYPDSGLSPSSRLPQSAQVDALFGADNKAGSGRFSRLSGDLVQEVTAKFSNRMTRKPQVKLEYLFIP